LTSRSELYTREMTTGGDQRLKMFVIPCSCGTTFAVSENYDRQGTAWNRYLKCPNCEKRHDPKNRLLQIGYHREGYWKVDDC
jgi:hydrogenase maturation factor HypF (carbamoyltransferase family)